jgi:serine protease AprX
VNSELVRWRLRWMRPALVLFLLAALAALAPAARAERPAEVIVQLEPGTSLGEGRELVRSVGGTVTRELELIDGLGASITRVAAKALERDERVEAVSPNARIESRGRDSIRRPKHLATSFNQSLGSARAWAGNLGTTGRGVGVAVVDTGIAGQLPDFHT